MKYNMDDIINEKFIDIEEEVFEKNKRRAIRRKTDVKKSLRKKKIAETCFYDSSGCYDNLHQYSKNKIHCSCFSCSGINKTNSKKINKGGAKPETRKYLGFGTTNHRMRKNWNISDIKKINSCESQIAVWD